MKSAETMSSKVTKVAFENPVDGMTIPMDALQEHVTWVAQNNMIEHRCIALCQSSGCGKSRTVKELAQRMFVCYLPFALTARSTQWPPASKLAELLLRILSEETNPNSLAETIRFLNAILFALTESVKSGMSPGEWYDYAQSQELANRVESTMMQKPLKEIKPTLQVQYVTRHLPQGVIVFAFDEASALLRDSKIEGFSLFRLLRRACNEQDVASFFLSTNSKVQNFYPAAHRDPSLRASSLEDPVLPRPLTSFVIPDCFLGSRSITPRLENLDSPQWMSFYGRPLWQALMRAWLGVGASLDSAESEVLKVAKLKLQLSCFDHCQVAVASLLACLTILPAIKLAETLVNCHMAQLLKVSSDRELLYVAYGSEPLLAWPAFCQLKGDPDGVIRATATAIHNGCLAVGVLGEVFVRLALLLERSRPQYQSLESFQRSIFEASDAPKDAYINFIQFIWAGQEIDDDILWEAFCRKAALVPKLPNQCGYDLIIPVCQGTEGQSLSPADIGAVFIQVKNQGASVSRLNLITGLNAATSHLSCWKSLWAFQRRPPSKARGTKSPLWECSLKSLSTSHKSLLLLLDCKYDPEKPFPDEHLEKESWYKSLRSYTILHNASVIQLKTRKKRRLSSSSKPQRSQRRRI
eukprot:Blabericola_migrator_1__11587@NODE_694_length_6838_cov_108_846108_g504_i0_p1_GENE_NODE_694_length_6838_cov_108_846108_g504_i0NODE_694_length_6838_cov_108_846108_g504_i0_p1_ORF_typecomplete_len638_score92_47TniB/PF05621_11/0_0015AAA_22/PF13401_6/0_032AAA_22/PF13401_6/7_1e03AAA_16/PF13191_6/0_052_NODE_694_length_6838_cov_108_846108_g504_i048016714